MKQNMAEAVHEKAPSELPKLVHLQLTKISQFFSLSQRLMLARMRESCSSEEMIASRHCPKHGSRSLGRCKDERGFFATRLCKNSTITYYFTLHVHGDSCKSVPLLDIIVNLNGFYLMTITFNLFHDYL